jgi:hypothetical protein
LTDTVCNEGYCYAGQALVQIARSKYGNMEYAIKFFARLEAFQAEANQYSNTDCPIRQFLPTVRCTMLVLPILSIHTHAFIFTSAWLCSSSVCLLRESPISQMYSTNSHRRWDSRKLVFYFGSTMIHDGVYIVEPERLKVRFEVCLL